MTTNPSEILARLHRIDPERYGATRNAIDGAVTRLSPYLTHGVLTLAEVRDVAYAVAGKQASYKLVFELAWREFFQRTWWERGDGIFSDIRRPQASVREYNEVPAALLDAKTGIRAIDRSIEQLYEVGYVHNHARMWTAMLGANVAQVHWEPLARWYYYHLLDGDLASNSLSFQWIAGTFSNKKYLATQEMINKFDRKSQQSETFLDISLDVLLKQQEIPEILQETRPLELPCTLPAGEPVEVSAGASVLLYHPWSLRPDWHASDTDAQRVLVLEPSHFARFPISPRRMDFILALSKNIPGLQVFVGESDKIPGLSDAASTTSVSHPATRHFPGTKEAPTWLFPQWLVSRRMPPSFMSFWKDVEHWL
jgi:deoxyribodipyrimidine photo-lyase